jgi:hypothetical protein
MRRFSQWQTTGPTPMGFVHKFLGSWLLVCLGVATRRGQASGVAPAPDSGVSQVG